MKPQLLSKKKKRKYGQYNHVSIFEPLPSSFEKDPVKRWMKQAKADEELYWRTKFKEMI